jgi:hypothetical protein
VELELEPEPGLELAVVQAAVVERVLFVSRDDLGLGPSPRYLALTSLGYL